MDGARSNQWFDDRFAGQSLMAILRGFGVERTVELATTAWDAGIELVEIPIQTPTDLEALAATVEAGRDRGKLVGAGTVVTLKHVGQAAAHGAAFTVSPGLDLATVQESLASDLPTLPGIATASEIQQVMSLGLAWVKGFPASELGARWFEAMRGPFPGIRFVATGGMNASNVAEFLAAGVRVVAVGAAIGESDQLARLAAL